MKKFLQIFFFSFCALVVRNFYAQTVKDTGKVEIIQDPRVQEMMNKKIEINEKKDGKIPGYRIQIHFGSERDKAKEVKSKFIQKFDSIPAYEKYEQPNFKIRVGDFRTKLDAFRYMKLISPDFPGSFIVQDEIEMKEVEK